jgi:putative nucleotidyltransferase with HDIG domain
VAVALSNATLIEEMDQLSWGTLKALARTVDAKSSWTAGHSTRVTKMALKIGSVLAISPKKLDDLHRAALLHDIGKVGIPLSILDKPGALDDEEYAMIKKHPSIGARILEPIASYKNILPMVLQHHERFDGKGYPDGLSGDEIDIGARILAVADVFDAIKSDRPYRKGMALERVIDIITEEAGRQFDPVVVDAFLEIMRQEKTKAA